MTLDFKKYNKQLCKQIKKLNLANRELEEKVANENLHQLHTMLMKSDFAGFKQNQQMMIECDKNQSADLIDANLYEKELEKIARNQKR